MSSWQDTVMSDQQMMDLERELCRAEADHRLCEAQAEITGKIMKQEGRREVVEWLEKEIWAHYTDPSGEYHWIRMKAPQAIRLERWQTKLKDWGIEK